MCGVDIQREADLFIKFTLYPAQFRVGRINLVLRYCAPHLPPTFWGIVRWVADLNVALCLDTRAKNENINLKKYFTAPCLFLLILNFDILIECGVELSYLNRNVSISAGKRTATQHAMSRKFGRKWETECLNSRFPYLAVLRRKTWTRSYSYFYMLRTAFLLYL